MRRTSVKPPSSSFILTRPRPRHFPRYPSYDGCTPTPKPSISDWFRDITDNFASKFSDYTSEVRDQIEEKLQQLPDNLQELVDKADTELEKASRLDLSALGEELLAHLKAVRRLTAAQLKPLADRIKTWSVDNLTLFLKYATISPLASGCFAVACGKSHTPLASL